jgi:hypothetical protein
VTIPELRLDDLTWQEMVERIRLRIPAESGHAWTLHAPVDPGITLLELYAWLLEQRLYLMDQVPDPLVRGVLRLLGIDPPRPARPAVTVLELAAAADPAPLTVPAGTELRRDLDGRELVLTTDEPVTLVPAAGLRVTVGGVDRTSELGRADAAVTLFRPGGGPSDVRLELLVPATFDPPPDAVLSLLLELDGPGGIDPSWSPEAAAVPPPASVVWSREDDAGRFRDLEPVADDGSGDLDDGTGGLRRPGIVRIRYPDAWRPRQGSGSAAVSRVLRIRVEHPTFSSPPRLRAVTVNVVSVRHRRTIEPSGSGRSALDAQVAAWLPLPGCELEIPDAAGTLLDDAGSVNLQLREKGGTEHEWRSTDDLTFHGPDDRVFLIDRERGMLRFGDGLTGRIPVPSRRRDGEPPVLRIRYDLGGGTGGNVGARRRFAGGGIVGSSRVAAAWGRDSETVTAARARAAGALLRRHRAVTTDDHEHIALETPGVALARAHVAVGHRPDAPCVAVTGATTVFVVPTVPRDRGDDPDRIAAPEPDPGVLAAVQDRLDAARLLGSEVFVRGPRYRRMSLAVEVSGEAAGARWPRDRLRDALTRYLDPLAGGEQGLGWPFGAPLRPSDLLGRAQAALGDAVVVRSVAIGLDGEEPTEDCDDIALPAHDLVVLDRLDVRVTPEAALEGLP